ncbi:MAG: DUF4339 domain-containing protein, partial [Candidatus Hydrogenedentota bacterium]
MSEGTQQFYVAVDEESIGPLSADEAQDWVRAGRVTAESWIWNEGSGAWCSAAEHPAFSILLRDCSGKRELPREKEPTLIKEIHDSASDGVKERRQVIRDISSAGSFSVPLAVGARISNEASPEGDYSLKKEGAVSDSSKDEKSFNTEPHLGAEKVPTEREPKTDDGEGKPRVGEREEVARREATIVVLEGRKKKLEVAVARAKSTLDQLNAKAEGLEKRCQAAKKRMKEIEEEAERAGKELPELRRECARVEEERLAAEGNLREIRGRLSETEERLKEASAALVRAENERERKEKQLVELEAKLKEAAEKLEEAQREASSIDEAAEKARNAWEEAARAEKEAAALRKDLDRLQVQRGAYDAELALVRDRLKALRGEIAELEEKR